MSLGVAAAHVEGSSCETREELPGRVQAALKRCPHRPMSRVRADVNGTVVRLSGYVRSWYEKQLAQAAVLGVPGIGQLRNDLEVIPVARSA